MGTATIPYPDFTPGTAIESDEIEANQQAIVDFLNDNVAHTDGSKPFTGIPSLSGAAASNPYTANQLSRKQYVDDVAASVRASSAFIRGGVRGPLNSDSNGNLFIPHGFPGATPPIAAVLSVRHDGPNYGALEVSRKTVITVVSIDNANIVAKVSDASSGGPWSGFAGWYVHWVAYRGLGI